MAATPPNLAAQLVFNYGENDDHATAVLQHLRDALRFEALIAFAKASGLKAIKKNLKASLKNQMRARIVIGTDFFITDPSVLDDLFSLSKNNSLELYIQNREIKCTFHPKIYAFLKADKSAVVVGSSNLTNGGLHSNYEGSLEVTDSNCEFFEEIRDFIDDLINERTVIKATKATINKYRQDCEIYRLHHRRADRLIKTALDPKSPAFTDLASYLALMKREPSEKNFKEQVLIRTNNYTNSKDVLKRITQAPRLTKTMFKPLYFELLENGWHSGGLHRGKNNVTQWPKEFQNALNNLKSLPSPPIHEAYDQLNRDLKKVKGVGINVITEILHSFDGTRFAVMNQNSVSGMLLAGFSDYPPTPDKKKVTGSHYEQFCKEAKIVQNALKLKSFLELDALFNYAYWS